MTSKEFHDRLQQMPVTGGVHLSCDVAYLLEDLNNRLGKMEGRYEATKNPPIIARVTMESEPIRVEEPPPTASVNLMEVRKIPMLYREALVLPQPLLNRVVMGKTTPVRLFEEFKIMLPPDFTGDNRIVILASQEGSVAPAGVGVCIATLARCLPITDERGTVDIFGICRFKPFPVMNAFDLGFRLIETPEKLYFAEDGYDDSYSYKGSRYYWANMTPEGLGQASRE